MRYCRHRRTVPVLRGLPRSCLRALTRKSPLGLKSSWPNDLREKMRSIQSIRKEAQEWLRKNRVKTPPVPVERIAESLGATVRYLPFEGDDDLAGMLVRAKGQLIIGVNS